MLIIDPAKDIQSLPNKNAFVSSEAEAYYTRDMFMVGALTEV